VTTSTTFVQAGEKVGRRSGQIRLYRPEDFEPMRTAGALTAEALDLFGPLVKPGVTTASLDRGGCDVWLDGTQRVHLDKSESFDCECDDGCRRQL
jgi:hypothetical protein